MTDSQDCRHAFEEWASGVYELEMGKETYVDDYNRASWRAWQAAWDYRDKRDKERDV